MSIGQPRPSVQKVTFSGSLNWSRKRLRDVLHGERRCRRSLLALAGSLRLPRVLAARRRAPPAVRRRRRRPSSPSTRRRRQRLVFHVGAGVQVLVERSRRRSWPMTLPTLLACRSAPPRSIQSSARMTSASHSSSRASLPRTLNGWRIMRRMIGREHRALLEVGDHAGAEPLGEADARLPEFRLARAAAEHDHGPLGARRAAPRPRSTALLRRARRLRRHEALARPAIPAPCRAGDSWKPASRQI